jgi:hypothetical protein
MDTGGLARAGHRIIAWAAVACKPRHENLNTQRDSMPQRSGDDVACREDSRSGLGLRCRVAGARCGGSHIRPCGDGPPSRGHVQPLRVVPGWDVGLPLLQMGQPGLDRMLPVGHCGLAGRVGRLTAVLAPRRRPGLGHVAVPQVVAFAIASGEAMLRFVVDLRRQRPPTTPRPRCSRSGHSASPRPASTGRLGRVGVAPQP